MNQLNSVTSSSLINLTLTDGGAPIVVNADAIMAISPNTVGAGTLLYVYGHGTALKVTQAFTEIVPLLFHGNRAEADRFIQANQSAWGSYRQAS
jgi:hypothetical protein